MRVTMDFKMRLSIFCCIAACMLTVAVPLVSEATYGGRGAQAGISVPEDFVYLPPADIEAESGQASDPEETKELAVPEPPETSSGAELSPENGEIFVSVLNAGTGEVCQMELDDYITCVVSAEMPYTFNSEALKAQAVAARSYCIYKLANGSGHDNADVCTSYAHCAAFISKESLTEKYGEVTANKVLKKVGEAVEATSGQIITYQGKPALALFHSRSWKYTESSRNVWGGNLPYLVSVSTPEEDSISTVTVTEAEMKKIFASSSAVKVSTVIGTSLLTSEKNDTGRQASLFYQGKEITAKSLRSLLGLRSCSFDYTKTADGWVFTVHGYGHGVGMSQYGANQMAIDGSTYDEILTHYYTGVTLDSIANITLPER